MIKLNQIKKHDPDAVKILKEEPVMRSVFGNQSLTNVLYEDRWGNQFRQPIWH